MITAEELKNAQAELSDEELEGVAGGFVLIRKRHTRSLYGGGDCI